MAKYQVNYSVLASGSVVVEAADEAAARGLVYDLSTEVLVANANFKGGLGVDDDVAMVDDETFITDDTIVANIGCNQCGGFFSCTAGDHLAGSGCPACEPETSENSFDYR
jgi:hypothetical protein